MSAPPDAPRSRRAAILRRTWTGAAIGAGAGLLVLLADRLESTLPVLAIASLLAALTVRELTRLGALATAARTVGLWLAWAVAVAGAWAGLDGALERGPTGTVLVALAAGAAGLIGHAAAGGRRAAQASRTALLALWVAPPLPLLAWLHWDFGTGGLVLLIVLSKIGDIAGYYGGNAFGRHHPFPRLSPGKTTEGCLASLVGGAAMGAALGAAGLLPDVRGDLSPLAVGLGVGIALNLAAQAGDLVESHAKRSSRVKDSSAALGASGGFLDVVDSLLLTVPAALLLFGLVFERLPG